MAYMAAEQKVKSDRQELVNKIIKNMEKGYILTPDRWNKTSLRPYNPSTNLCYRGINRLRLMNQAIEKGYTDPRWCTLKQANQNGWSILPGEHGTRIEKWIWSEKKEQINPETGEIENVDVPLEHGYPMVYTVFNAQQIRNIPELENTYTNSENLNVVRDTLIASSECNIQHAAQDRAYYSPSEDKILLPPENYFKTQEAYLATMIHEMGHSTGHPDRLNRPILNSFGTPDYAREELRAELSAAFLQSDLGLNISDMQLQDHSNYLLSWIEVLKNDPNELFRACKDAELMSERLFNNYEKALAQENTIQQEDTLSPNVYKEEEISIDKTTTYFTILKNPDNVGFDLYKIKPSGDIVSISEYDNEHLDFNAAWYKLKAYQANPEYTYIEPIHFHAYANAMQNVQNTSPLPNLNDAKALINDLNLTPEEKAKYVLKMEELSSNGQTEKAADFLEKVKKKSYGNDVCDQYDKACNLISKYNLTEEDKEFLYKSLHSKVLTHFYAYGTDQFITTKNDIKSFLIEVKQSSDENEQLARKIYNAYKSLGTPISSDTARAINIINQCTHKEHSFSELQRFCRSADAAFAGPHEKSLKLATSTINQEFTSKGYDKPLVIAPEQ